MKAFGAKLSELAASPPPNGRAKLRTNPPPTAALATRKLRRLRSASAACDERWLRIMSASLCVRLGGELDRFANTDIGPAPADIAAHSVIDVAIRRMWVARQKRRSRHDLPGLAIAALD